MASLLLRSMWRARALARRARSRWRVAERPIGGEIGEAELRVVERVLRSGRSLSFGDEVPAFERALTSRTGARHAVAVSSGTAALELAAALLRIKQGDEVVVPAQTFRATLLPLLRRGASLRFADTAPDTLNVDVDSVRRQLSAQTRAIFVVHHGGHPAPLAELRALAGERGVTIVEDCAHALGASVGSEPIGTGELCCFSFQSLKQATTLGEGGALLTSNAVWAQEARALRSARVIGPRTRRSSPLHSPPLPTGVDDDSDDAWWSDLAAMEEVGTTARMSEVAAAVGRLQLDRLDEQLHRRAAISAAYDEALAEVPGCAPFAAPEGASSSWHLYSLLVDPDTVDRQALLQRLVHEHRVQVRLRYFPAHLLAASRALGHKMGDAPDAERTFFHRLVQVPLHASMSRRDVAHVARSVADAARRARR